MSPGHWAALWLGGRENVIIMNPSSLWHCHLIQNLLHYKTKQSKSKSKVKLRNYLMFKNFTRTGDSEQ